MKSKNIAVAVIIIVILAIAWYMYSNSTQSGVVPTTATTTPTTTTNDNPAPTADASVVPEPAAVAGVPGIQTGLLNVPSNTGVVVTGYIAPNGSATNYWYEYGTTKSLGTSTAPQNAGSGFVTLATPAYLTNLAPNTTYYYRLSAQNASGAVQGVTYSFTTTKNAAPAGTAPSATTESATGIGELGAILAGHINPNGTQTTYWFEYGTSQNFGNVTAFGLAGNGTASIAVSVPVSSLKSHTKYYFRLVTQSQFGIVKGTSQSFTTLSLPQGGSQPVR